MKRTKISLQGRYLVGVSVDRIGAMASKKTHKSWDKFGSCSLWRFQTFQVSPCFRANSNHLGTSQVYSTNISAVCFCYCIYLLPVNLQNGNRVPAPLLQQPDLLTSSVTAPCFKRKPHVPCLSFRHLT